MTEIQQNIINALQSQNRAMMEVCNLLEHSTIGDDLNNIKDFAHAFDNRDGLAEYFREISQVNDLRKDLITMWREE